MSYDIFGEPLRMGHCEVHPHIHEEYPCSLCIAEKREETGIRDRQTEVLMEQAQVAHQAGHALSLPAGSDITTALVPAVLAVKSQRDELLEALIAITNHFANVMGGPMIAGSGVSFVNGVEGIPTIRDARVAIAKAKGGAA